MYIHEVKPEQEGFGIDAVGVEGEGRGREGGREGGRGGSVRGGGALE